MKKKEKKTKERIWMPQVKAETFKDKRTKRRRTRNADTRKAIRESRDD